MRGYFWGLTAACGWIPVIVTGCDDSGAQHKPQSAAAGPLVPPVPPAAASSGPSRDCTPICNDYWMYLAREHRLCGGGSDFVDRRWSTRACWRARSDGAETIAQVDATEEGREDAKGPLCKCGKSELPRKRADRQQESSEACSSFCDRAAAQRVKLEQCGGLPGSPEYDDPGCYDVERRFFAMRPRIFECWCTQIHHLDRSVGPAPSASSHSSTSR